MNNVTFEHINVFSTYYAYVFDNYLRVEYLL